ncbi:hypothetical protein MTO96_004993 [Rhipicephalus appendiculatus]
MHRRQPWHRKQQFFEGQDTLEYVLLVSGVLSFQFALALLSYIAERYHAVPQDEPRTGLTHRYFHQGGRPLVNRESLRPLVHGESLTRGPGDVRERAAYLYDMLPQGFRNSAFALKLRGIAECGRRGKTCVGLDAGLPHRLIENVDLTEFAEWKRQACAFEEASGEEGALRRAGPSAAATSSYQRTPTLDCHGWRNWTNES